MVESHSGVVLATRSTLISPDQNGDLIVDEADVALAAGKLSTSDPTADFDFDGTVTNADLAILEEHLGHQDPLHAAPTPTQPLTWGRVKSLYRGR